LRWIRSPPGLYLYLYLYPPGLYLNGTFTEVKAHQTWFVLAWLTTRETERSEPAWIHTSVWTLKWVALNNSRIGELIYYIWCRNVLHVTLWHCPLLTDWRPPTILSCCWTPSIELCNVVISFSKYEACAKTNQDRLTESLTKIQELEKAAANQKSDVNEVIINNIAMCYTHGELELERSSCNIAMCYTHSELELERSSCNIAMCYTHGELEQSSCNIAMCYTHGELERSSYDTKHFKMIPKIRTCHFWKCHVMITMIWIVNRIVKFKMCHWVSLDSMLSCVFWLYTFFLI